jgi:hypothetical protein
MNHDTRPLECFYTGCGEEWKVGEKCDSTKGYKLAGVVACVCKISAFRRLRQEDREFEANLST